MVNTVKFAFCVRVRGEQSLKNLKADPVLNFWLSLLTTLFLWDIPILRLSPFYNYMLGSPTTLEEFTCLILHTTMLLGNNEDLARPSLVCVQSCTVSQWWHKKACLSISYRYLEARQLNTHDHTLIQSKAAPSDDHGELGTQKYKDLTIGEKIGLGKELSEAV